MRGFFGSLFSAVFSRAMLALVAFALGACAIWFLGPLLSFGSLQPLASVEMRFTTLVLLLAFVLLLLLGWSVSIVGAAALCLLVWHAGPLLALGTTRPLLPVWVRAAIILGLLLVYALYGLYRLWQALRADQSLLQRVLHPGQSRSPNIARDEIRTLAAIVYDGVARLKHMRTNSAFGLGGLLRRLVEGKRYLYELPWYMVIGVPGSGKTAALLNSGCRFPLTNEAGPIRHVGTLNTHWWFTNEAVLIDTAGRYTLQGDGTPLADATAADHAPTADISSTQKNAAEWLGYLALLRKHRPRAPINGALLTVDLGDLVSMDEQHRTQLAGVLRGRLTELRQHLGVRFPVYVLVTKCDLLKGFTDYFSALTSEGRAQPWGFTLPWDEEGSGLKRLIGARPNTATDNADDAAGLRAQIGTELHALRLRLDDGLALRLQEEFDLQRRQNLYALPQELGGVIPGLTQMLQEVFLDSRYDTTQTRHNLRGVYFTSAMQEGRTVQAEPATLLARLGRALKRIGTELLPSAGLATHTGARSYFLHDVLTKQVFRESHLVRPNLHWEARFRVMRVLGHCLALVLFLWLASGLWLSYGNNRAYLDLVGAKTKRLQEQVAQLYTKFQMDAVADTLDASHALPSAGGLDTADPPIGYLYGLYTPPPVVTAAGDTYAQLQNRLLVPQIVRRMEMVLRDAVQSQEGLPKDRQDTAAIYETLRVYLMLHEKDRFQAGDVRDWVLRDWQSASGAKAFGARAAMLDHLKTLFSGDRLVQSEALPNELLVRRARLVLDGNSSTQRLYERARNALTAEMPPDFTLLRVLGPQAGAVFTRASGAPLERGVPGTYTYEGYHEIFAKKLPDMVLKAQEDDAWVMNTRKTMSLDALQNKAQDVAARMAEVAPLMEDIRRQYLVEYTRQWTSFLEDIRPVTGNTLAFDVGVARQFAGADSPLLRLARAAVRETTLSRPIDTKPADEKSYFERANEALNKQANEVKKNLGLRAEVRLERQLVDSQFSALREVVTGQADAAISGAPIPGAAPRIGTENIMAMLNEFYTMLVVAETAVANNSTPPAGNDVAAKLRLESAKLPAPFKDVLAGLASAGSEQVMQGTAGILRGQATSQFERLMGLLALHVSEPCKRAIDGRYPFAAASASAAEVNVDDFNALFASGGTADDYFTKYLGPFIDTSLRPWRYKNPATANLTSGPEVFGSAAPPATTGPTLTGELLKLLAQNGPPPESFARMAQIREVFFREQGAKRMAWKLDMRVLELDASINELVINIDGQSQRYAHGPVQPMSLNWPGPRGGSVAELTAQPRIRPESSTLVASGPWGLMRLLEKGKTVDTATSGRATVELSFDGRKAVLEWSSAGSANPLTTDLLRGFKCPSRV